MKARKLKIGLFGAGHLGKIHLKNMLAIPNLFEFVGFYDPNSETSAAVIQEYHVSEFHSITDLIQQVDCVAIVAPTFAHFDLALEAIRAGKHVFIEKPFTSRSVHAEILLKEAKLTDVKVQIGHVERFNPAFVEGQKMLLNPKFLEIHRLATYNPRGTDVSVVMDLMIHDLDLLLQIVKSPVMSIQASGVGVIHDTPDMASVRIQFENNCVANLTSSRISLQNMRRIRVFQDHSYVSMDLLNHKADRITLSNEKTVNSITEIQKNLFVGVHQANISKGNAILEELQNFHAGILENKQIIVTGEDGFNVLLLAEQIMLEINSQSAVSAKFKND